MENVLITGISGALARILARSLAGAHRVCGVDVVPWRSAPQGVRIHLADVRKRSFEDAIRRERPDAIVHLGFIRHFQSDERHRHDVNVRGTKRLLDHCLRYGVKRLVVVSSSYVYGAFAENPFHMTEDAPLSASRTYPEIRDLVEVDTLASGFLWKEPSVTTCVLRPVNVIGPTAHSMAARYLGLPRVPTVMGFDPMMQFIHEEDVAGAIARALGCGLRGVFNVVGPGEVPVRTAIHETGGVAWPVPEVLLRSTFGTLFRLGFGDFPQGMLDYLKYPVTLDGRPFAAATGFEPAHGLADCFESVRRSRR
ncbi:MAG: NAD-dependent epimerase/dehydratase family protein [Myxococcota bacterium]